MPPPPFAGFAGAGLKVSGISSGVLFFFYSGQHKVQDSTLFRPIFGRFFLASFPNEKTCQNSKYLKNKTTTGRLLEIRIEPLKTPLSTGL